MPHCASRAILAVTIWLVVALPALAAVVDVTCQNGTADASTLNTAISGSHVGDRIAIHGTCLINATIVLYGDRAYEGDSRTGTVIRQADRSNLAVMLASDSWASANLYDQYPTSTGAPVRISRLTIDGNKTTNSGTTALVIRSWQTVIEDLQIENAPVDGIQITNLNQKGVALTTSQVNGRISDIFITGSGANGIHVIDTGNACTDWDILDSWIGYSGQSAITMDNAAGWKIRGNHLYGVSGNGIFANRCYGTAIDGNYIEDFGHLGGAGNTFYGIACTVQGGDGTYPTGNSLQGGAGTMVTGNKVFQYSANGGDASTGNLVYIGVPQVNYGTGMVNVVDNLINGRNGANTTGLSFQLGSGVGLDILVSNNNVQSVAIAESVGTGVKLVGQPVIPLIPIHR